MSQEYTIAKFQCLNYRIIHKLHIFYYSVYDIIQSSFLNIKVISSKYININTLQYNLEITNMKSASSIEEQLYNEIISRTKLLYQACSSGNLDTVVNLVEFFGGLDNFHLPLENALFPATKGNHANIVKFLIAKGIDVNGKDEHGQSALFFAAAYGRIAALEELLKVKNIKINITNFEGNTPLLIAVKQNQTEAALLLIKNKADVNIIDKFEQCALLVVTCTGNERIAEALLNVTGILIEQGQNEETPLLNAISKGFEKIALMLIQKGAQLRFPHHENEETPLFRASFYNRLNLITFLIKAGASLEIGNRMNQTPLCVASAHGSLDIAKLLINARANVNAVARDGYTPLLAAASYKHRATSEYLISAGANVNAETGIDERNKGGETALHLAIANNAIDVVQLLISKKANLEHQSNITRTPLMEAVRANSIPCLRLLLDAKATPNANNVDGLNALYVSAMLGYDEISKILLAAGATIYPNLDQNSRTTLLTKGVTLWKRSALAVAVKENQLKTVQLLLQHCLSDSFSTPVLMVEIVKQVLLIATQFEKEAIIEFIFNSSVYKKFCSKHTLEEILFEAICFNRISLVQTLLKLNVSVEATPHGNEGSTPIFYAARQGNLEIVKLLAQHKANINAKQAFNNSTPLMAASFNGELEIVKFLLNQKPSADIDTVSTDGENALMIAAIERQFSVLRHLFRFKLFLALKDIREKHKNKLSNIWKLAGLISDRICDFNPKFDINYGIDIACNIKALTFSQDRNAQIQFIPFDLLISNIQDCFEKLRLDIEPLQVDLKIFEKQLLTAINVKSSTLKTETPENVQALEKKNKKEKSMVQQNASSIILAGLDYQSIQSQFPLVNHEGLDIFKVTEEIRDLSETLKDSIYESRSFLNLPIATRTQLKLEISNLQNENEIYYNEIENILQKLISKLENNEASDLKMGFEQRILHLQQLFLQRYSDIRLNILAKLELPDINAAKALKDEIPKDEILANILKEQHELINSLNEMNRKLKTIQQHLDKKLRKESDARKEYYLTYQRELVEELEEHEAAKAKDMEMSKSQERRLQREIEKKQRQEKLLKRKETSRQYFQLKHSQTEDRLTHTKLHLSMASPTSTLGTAEAELEFSMLQQALAQLNQATKQDWSNKLQMSQAYGLLKLSARLMEILIQLPPSLHLMSHSRASHFRDVVFHAFELPTFTLYEAQEMTDLIMKYIRAALENKQNLKTTYWEALCGKDLDVGKTLFAKLLEHKIEDDNIFASFEHYQKLFSEARNHASHYRTIVGGIDLLTRHAIDLFLGREGGFAARIRQFHPIKYAEQSETYQYGKSIRIGNSIRHRSKIDDTTTIQNLMSDCNASNTTNSAKPQEMLTYFVTQGQQSSVTAQQSHSHSLQTSNSEKRDYSGADRKSN